MGIGRASDPALSSGRTCEGIATPACPFLLSMAAKQEAISEALRRGHLVDISTTGRKSGGERRIEIAFHNIDGRLYISGMPSPRRRNWLANLASNPRFTFHLKGSVRADLTATARIIDDEAERREILPHIARVWNRKDVELMVKQSPLIEVTIEPPT
jgi:deazaflavin-dependent oxidoreductase (nitroreductase family)